MSKKAPLVVINIVGLTQSLLGRHTPHLNRLIEDGSITTAAGVFPAVTTTTQSSMVTGTPPSEHGVVGNGWYFRELAEVMFWKQSNRLVHGSKVWDRLKQVDSDFRVSKLFWWYNMYANVDNSITPRPHYAADGRKVMDLYSRPKGLHQSIEAEIGKFPFFNFWGPKAGIESSKWIGRAAELEFDQHKPDLQFVYLPHLDYNLQRLGPDDIKIWQDVAEIDAVAGRLIEHVKSGGAEVMVVSDYGIESVDTPVGINQVLREHGYIEVRESLGGEMLDAGASRAFAVADHQIAHIYVRDASDISTVKHLLEKVTGVERVLDETGKREFGIDHSNAGELIAIADERAWFTYYYWLDENKAPDFARTVDIHRKPGYDPVEMFVDPDITFPNLRIGRRVLQKLLGFRMLMDVIALKPELVKGSHGRLLNHSDKGPLLILPKTLASDQCSLLDVADLIERHFR